MGSINRVMIMGLIGSHPQLKFAKNGKPFVSLSLATHKRIKDADGNNNRQTQWHQVMLWGKNAEVCSTYCKKGAPLYVEGHLAPYTKNENGAVTHHISIVAEQIQFIPGTKTASSAERGEFEPVESLTPFADLHREETSPPLN